jgi:hypothetical protein
MIKTQRLIIPVRFISLNPLIDKAKQHWSKYAEPKADYTLIVKAYAQMQLKPIAVPPIDFHFHWICRDKKTDKDNIAAAKKFILDGIVAAKIIPSDNWKWVGEFRDTFDVDQKEYRVKVTLTYKEGVGNVSGVGNASRR